MPETDLRAVAAERKRYPSLTESNPRSCLAPYYREWVEKGKKKAGNKKSQQERKDWNMNKFDMMGKDAMNRMDDLMNSSKLNELLHRKDDDDKKKNSILWGLAILGAVAAVAAIAYAVYRFFTPDYLEDFEDDFDDDFDDDFFEDETESEK